MTFLSVVYRNFSLNGKVITSFPEVVFTYLVSSFLQKSIVTENCETFYTSYPLLPFQLSEEELTVYLPYNIVKEVPEYVGKIWLETVDGYCIPLDTINQDSLAYIRQGTFIVSFKDEERIYVKRKEDLFVSNAEHPCLPFVYKRLEELWY